MRITLSATPIPKLYGIRHSNCFLAGVFWTGGSLNPARSFAPAVALASFDTTQWVYWVGPCCGSILATLLLKLIKALEYESANPDLEAQGPTGPMRVAEP